MHVLGDLVHVKVTAQQTGGAFSMFEILVRRRRRRCTATRRARRSTSSTARSSSSAPTARRTPAAPGDTVFVAANAPHSYRNPGPGDARFLVTLAPGGFEAFFADLGSPRATPPSPPRSPTPPDVAHVLAVTRRHGIDILDGPPPRS